VDPVSDPLLVTKCGSTGNRTRDLSIYSKELWPLDYRGGRRNDTGVGFLRERLFSFPVLIPPTAPSSLIILSQTLDCLDTGPAPDLVRAPS
jgi:hypothetical protein